MKRWLQQEKKNKYKILLHHHQDKTYYLYRKDLDMSRDPRTDILGELKGKLIDNIWNMRYEIAEMIKFDNGLQNLFAQIISSFLCDFIRLGLRSVLALVLDLLTLATSEERVM